MALITGARDIKLDSDTKDLVIENGDLVLVSGVDALEQDIRLQLGFFQGEWFLDESVGVPYYQSILVKNPNLIGIKELFRAKLLSIPGVDEVLSLNLTYTNATRTLEVVWKVNTALGELSGTTIL